MIWRHDCWKFFSLFFLMIRMGFAFCCFFSTWQVRSMDSISLPPGFFLMFSLLVQNRSSTRYWWWVLEVDRRCMAIHPEVAPYVLFLFYIHMLVSKKIIIIEISTFCKMISSVPVNVVFSTRLTLISISRSHSAVQSYKWDCSTCSCLQGMRIGKGLFSLIWDSSGVKETGGKSFCGMNAYIHDNLYMMNGDNWQDRNWDSGIVFLSFFFFCWVDTFGI